MNASHPEGVETREVLVASVIGRRGRLREVERKRRVVRVE